MDMPLDDNLTYFEKISKINKIYSGLSDEWEKAVNKLFEDKTVDKNLRLFLLLHMQRDAVLGYSQVLRDEQVLVLIAELFEKCKKLEEIASQSSEEFKDSLQDTKERIAELNEEIKKKKTISFFKDSSFALFNSNMTGLGIGD